MNQTRREYRRAAAEPRGADPVDAEPGPTSRSRRCPSDTTCRACGPSIRNRRRPGRPRDDTRRRRHVGAHRRILESDSGGHPPGDRIFLVRRQCDAVTGAVAFQILLPYESTREVPVLTPYPKPNAVWSIVVPIPRRPRRMVYDGDPPKNWGPAIFQQMLLGWRVNTGEIAHDSKISEPCYVDLVCFENANRPRRRTVPFYT